MPSAAAMRVGGLNGTYWADPHDAARLEQWKWRKVVYPAVDAASDESRAARLGVQSLRGGLLYKIFFECESRDKASFAVFFF